MPDVKKKKKTTQTPTSLWAEDLLIVKVVSVKPRIECFSLDVTAAILVSQNNETAAMLVSQTNPLGAVLFSYANAFFCSNKFA